MIEKLSLFSFIRMVFLTNALPLKWKGSFSFAPLMDLTFTDPIDSVIPGDYNYDGLLDLLLVSADQDKKQTNLQYFFRKKASPFFGIEV